MNINENIEILISTIIIIIIFIFAIKIMIDTGNRYTATIITSDIKTYNPNELRTTTTYIDYYCDDNPIQIFFNDIPIELYYGYYEYYWKCNNNIINFTLTSEENIIVEVR